MPQKKILIVDDEPDVVEVLKIRFQSEGYDVISEDDGVRGLNLARKEKPDLIILDVMLPNLDGYQICRMLKFDNTYKNIPIIMFTARAGTEDKAKAEKAGADAYIVKPFEPKTLLTKAKELLNGKG